MLEQLAPSLWAASTPSRVLGLELGARITVVRLNRGDLWVHSPIEPTPPLRAALDALGPVRCLIAPSKMHYLRLAAFGDAYPKARRFGAPDLVQAMPKLKFDGTLRDAPEPEWQAELDQLLFQGSREANEAVFFHRASRTLILTDLCFYLGREQPPLTRLYARLSGILDKLGPTLLWRLLLRDRATARHCIERILAWDFDRVIVSHGKILETGGHAAFREAFVWLLK